MNDLSQKWGFIDPAGEVVIEAVFEKVQSFREGLAAVRLDSRWGVIDQTGEFVVPPKFDEIGPFADGMAYARQNGAAYGYIDKTGRYVIGPRKGLAARTFADGLAQFEADGLIGFINHSGRIVIVPRFNYAAQFSCGYAAVRDPVNFFRQWYINKQGEFQYGPFQRAETFSEGLAAVMDEKLCCFIDVKGNTVLTLPSSITARRFTQGLAPIQVVSKNKYGYIDRLGKIVIEPAFDHAYCFRNGLACVEKDGTKGLINLKGNYIVEPVYDEVGDLENGRVSFRLGDVYGFLDSEGETMIEPVYRFVKPFTEGLAGICINETSSGDARVC